MKHRSLPFLTVKRRITANPTINIVPLVDVLLVLLVILLVTAPALLHAVRTKLPHADAEPATPPQEAIILTLTASGTLLWNGEPLPARYFQNGWQRSLTVHNPAHHLRCCLRWNARCRSKPRHN